jgi:hypothetical protein
MTNEHNFIVQDFQIWDRLDVQIFSFEIIQRKLGLISKI